MDEGKITVIGAGLAGSLIAIMLAKQGYTIDIYEKRSDLRSSEQIAGKSINLALSHRGWKALNRVGLEQQVLKQVVPMKGRLIHDKNGNTSFQAYGKDETEVINSVSRRDLNALLLDSAEEEENVSIYFNHKCRRYDPRKDLLFFENQNEKVFTIHPHRIIAADGALSSIRRSLLPVDRFNYSQQYLSYGYKELEILPKENGEFRLRPNVLHIWPRESFMMIALPNYDGSFTCTLFAPFKGEIGLEEISTIDQVRSFFSSEFPDIIPHLHNLDGQYFGNPTGKLITVKCNPWNFKDKVLLIGDAAHAIIPFYGQGMNAAFEDCRILSELIEKYEGDFSKVFPTFSRIRKPNADAISQLSFDNFVEMRDKVADESFLERKKAELQLYEKYPDLISKYAMVTFHPEIPYRIAKLKGEILEKTVQKYFKKIHSIEEFDPKEVKEELLIEYSRIDMEFGNYDPM